MRMFVPSLLVLGAVVLVNIIGAIAFVGAGKLALYLDPVANESHLSSFIVAVTGVAVAVTSAFPILGRLLPFIAERLARIWPDRPPEGPAA
jgi:hypothetical protein